MDLTKLSLEQLKALIYDNVMLIEKLNKNSKIVTAEIQKRQLVEEEKPLKDN